MFRKNGKAVVLLFMVMLVLPCGAAAQTGSGAAVSREDHTFQQTGDLRYRVDSFVRMLRSKSAYYGKVAYQAIVRTIREKPMAAMLSLVLIAIPPVFGFKMGPAVLMAAVYFGLNVFMDLGAVGYLVAIGFGFIIAVNNIFD